MASPTRVSGMVSGMDTESVVKAYVQSYIDKKDKIIKSQNQLFELILLNSNFEVKGTLKNIQSLYLIYLLFL